MIDTLSPLDPIERALKEQGIPYARVEGEQLLAFEVRGDLDTYKTALWWDGEDDAVQFAMTMPAAIPEEVRDLAAPVILHINKGMWIGHFVLNDMLEPEFRYAAFLRGQRDMEDVVAIGQIIDAARDLCDANLPAFRLIAQATPETFPRLIERDGSLAPLALALLNTVGEA